MLHKDYLTLWRNCYSTLAHFYMFWGSKTKTTRRNKYFPHYSKTCQKLLYLRKMMAVAVCGHMIHQKAGLWH